MVNNRCKAHPEYNANCNDCINKRKAYNENAKHYNKKYRDTHKEQTAKRGKLYEQTNASKIAKRKQGYYLKNKLKINKRNNEKIGIYKQRIRQFLNAVKAVPCMDCGNCFPPYCMDFDHKENEIKLFNISNISSISMDKLNAEIAKCDIICSNCHRIRTHNRGYINQFTPKKK